MSYCIYLLHIYPVRLIDTITKKFVNPNLAVAIIDVVVACVCGWIWYICVEKRVQSFLRSKVVKKQNG